MILAVLDTNVWVRGIFFRGRPYRVLAAWRDRQFEVVCTLEVLTEIRSKLAIKAAQFGASVDDVQSWLDYISTYATLVAPTGAATGVCRDPADDKFLDAALSAGAQYLVTGDQDLLVIKQHRTVEIVSPHEFIQVLLTSGERRP